MHETTDQIRRVARQRSSKPVRTPTPVERWAWTPVFVLRFGLVASYVIVSYVAIIALISGIPAFDQEGRTWHGFTTWWGAAMLLGGVLATVCISVEDPLRPTRRAIQWAELIALGVVLVMAATYSGSLHIIAFATGDQNRQTVAAVSLALSVLPFARFLWLALQVGKKKATGGA